MGLHLEIMGVQENPFSWRRAQL